MSLSRHVRTTSLVVGMVLLVVLGSDVSGLAGDQHGFKTATATAALQAASSVPRAPFLGVAPADGSEDLSPTARVGASVLDGTLTDVTLTDDYGNTIAGAMSADRTSWQPTQQLRYSREYTMKVASRSTSGVPLIRSSTFETVSPDYLTQVYLETPGGLPIREEQRYGIGTVVAARFDEPIKDKAAAESHLKVTTTPAVQGSWYWVDDQTAHWRPEKYYAPGTKVSLAANLFGVNLGDGFYGQKDVATSFTIGDAHVSVADDTNKQVSVFNGGKLVRTMPTSMGRGGMETISGRTFSFWTPPGVYTVIDKAAKVVMDSSSYGLPVASSMGYKLTIPNATRISTDGIYLHQLNDTIWAQGNTNTSHGCLNLNSDNAKWFYDFSQPGDVVEVRNTGGPPLQIWQNGDWTMSWGDWLKGSALSPKS